MPVDQRKCLAKKILIIGRGRSGTHWLAHTLEKHPDIYIDIECPPVFGWVTEMAMDPRKERDLLPRVVSRYQAYHRLVMPKHLADKSHPALWIADHLAQTMPDVVFLAIRRTIEPTVASMLQHRGVRRWVENWNRYPIPNRFLGITSDDMGAYAGMTLAERCAVRVIAHSREIERLRPVLGARLHVIEYESLLDDPAGESVALSRFLDLATPLVPPVPRVQSNDQWRNTLTTAETRNIRGLAERLNALDFMHDRHD